MSNQSAASMPDEDEIQAALPELVHTGTTELYVVIGLLAYLGLVGTIGNALVLFVFSKKKDKMVSTLFIMVMAIVDLTTCVVVMPFTMYMEWVDFKVDYDIICKVYQFLITSNIPFSALIMSAIAIDRYLCICHPFLHILNLQRAKIMTICLAMFASSLGIIVALMYSVYQVAPPKTTLLHNATGGLNNSGSETVTYSDGMNPNDTILETEMIIKDRKILYTSQCAPSEIVVSKTFMWYYQKFYNAMYLVCLIIVIVLYTLIYKSVLTRRSKRAKQKSKALPIVERNPDGQTSSAQDTLLTPVDRDVEETCVSTNGATINGTKSTAKNSKKESKKSKDDRKKDKERKKSKKGDQNRMANLKTAAMLFVVTVVFIVTFLPAFLMALTMIPYNMIVFYMYFANNVANPVIYSFMNRNFRDDLKKIFCR